MDEPLKLQCLLAREPAHSELDEQNLRFPPFLKKKKKKKRKKKEKNQLRTKQFYFAVDILSSKERERARGR